MCYRMLIFQQRNTFQAALVTDGLQSYTVFIYHCGLLQWRAPELRIGFQSQNFSSAKLHRSIHLTNVTSDLACANLPNEWNTLVYGLTEIEGMYRSEKMFRLGITVTKTK